MTKPKRPRDTNQLARFVVGLATDDPNITENLPPEDGKNPAAVALGRLGGLKGGKARANSLTQEERKAIAAKAAASRWAKNATAQGGQSSGRQSKNALTRKKSKKIP
jgi:hypothetical protein